MNEVAEQLELVGDALQRAWRHDHVTHRQQPITRFGRRRVAIAATLAVLALGGGVALAANFLKTPAAEETGMTEGYRLFVGSHPNCTSVSATSFHCTLATPPSGETFYNQDGSQALDVFLGMKAETVDADRHVDGACVSVSTDGRSWDCFLGDAAVSQGLIDRGYLGTYLPTPPTA
jgi:hypothetical protein